MLQLDERPVRAEAPSESSATTVSSWSGKAREDAVQRMFTAIARFYDLNNSLLSFGLHHRWKKLAASYVPTVENGRAVDIGAGTADLALPIERRMGPKGYVVAMDLNDAMLREGARKVARRGLSRRIPCLRANAEDLGLQDESVDAVTAGFCVRNVGNLLRALAEIHRVLKPGGRFVCLEFSQPVRPWLLAFAGSDAADLGATLAARGEELPPRSKPGTAIAAGSFGAAALLLARREEA